jgi:beta-phosphoglucomutase-like phosphatase (HAD superfamily)
MSAARGRDVGKPEVARAIIEGVAQRIAERGTLLPGALDAMARFERRGLTLGLASSSHHRLIGAALTKLELKDLFAAVCSADEVASNLSCSHPLRMLRDLAASQAPARTSRT